MRNKGQVRLRDHHDNRAAMARPSGDSKYARKVAFCEAAGIPAVRVADKRAAWGGSNLPSRLPWWLRVDEALASAFRVGIPVGPLEGTRPAPRAMRAPHFDLVTSLTRLPGGRWGR